MKKIISILCACVASLAFIFVGGCESGNNTIVIAVPDGAPVLAVYNMISEGGKIGGYDVEFKIVSSAEQIGTMLTSKQADVCVMPTNMAAKLYNKGVDLKLASVNVFGVLYMIGNESIATLSDLVGKVVVYTGAGGTPELTLKLIFDENGVEYVQSETAVEGKVAITSVSAGSEAIVKMKSKQADYAVLGEPVVTQANSVLGTKVVLDLQKEWAKIIGDESYTQAGVVLSSTVYNKNVFVRGLMEKLAQNSEYLAADYENVKATLENAGSSLRVNFTAETVERLNIGHKTAVEARGQLEKYFTALYDYDKTLIGGALPSDGFYYGYEK